jgi:TPR repeat protein
VLRGVELARAFLAENPSPQAIQDQGEDQEQAGDCDAALVLYNRAANADAGFALTLARRFDPEGFVGQGCIQAPDAINASVLYEAPAGAGDTAAQRRLGQILVDREDSGPLFEAGVRWLRLAAQAGDQEAQRLLSRLREL